MITKTKTIKMLLYDGSLNGVANLSDSAWESGKMYSAPRESITNLITRADCKKYGVYLLLSNEQVYVGQAIDLERRTKQHLMDKDWWDHVVLMTTKDDSFNASDIDYLESRLINMAMQAGTADSDNKKVGNRQKVDEFRQAELEQYLEEAIFLLSIIGVRVFEKTHRRTSLNQNHTIRLGTVTGQNLNGEKPQLPDIRLAPGVFAKTALQNLLESGYKFTTEQMQRYVSVEGSKEYTTRNLPLFWILNEGESRSTCDNVVKSRYWKDEFVSGEYRFLMYSQWYEDTQRGAHRRNFIKWYESL